MGKIKPEQFDLLGVVFFPFVFFCGLYMLVTGNILPQALVIVFVLSGIVGFLIDGSIVYRTFIKHPNK